MSYIGASTKGKWLCTNYINNNFILIKIIRVFTFKLLNKSLYKLLFALRYSAAQLLSFYMTRYLRGSRVSCSLRKPVDIQYWWRFTTPELGWYFWLVTLCYPVLTHVFWSWEARNDSFCFLLKMQQETESCVLDEDPLAVSSELTKKAKTNRRTWELSTQARI